MSINPITVTRLKTFVIVGHSNADGWASSDLMLNNYEDFLPGTSSPSANPQLAYWKNVYVATSAQPFPLPDHTPVASDVGDVEWLEMTISNPETPAAPHPHASPYTFPNVKGSCYPNWMYDAEELLPGGGGTGTTVGVEIPFSWFWHHHWNEQVGMVKLAKSSTFLMRQDTGGDATTWFDVKGYSAYSPADPLYVRSAVDPTDGFFGWWTPSEHFDWAPGTDRLYKKWYDKMTGAQSALPDGTKMDVRLLIIWMGDNESLGRDEDVLADNAFYNAFKTLRDKMRQACVDNDWTTLPAHQIAVVTPKVYSGYPPNVDFVNGELERLAKDDPYMRLCEVEDWLTMEDDGYSTIAPSSANHYGADGYVQAAKDIYEAYQEIEVEPFDAIAEEDRFDVDEVKNRVRTYYGRSRASTDIDDTTVLQHINGSLNSILNQVGDNAYWLRRRAVLSLAFAANSAVSMPKYVQRVLKIEDPRDITRPMIWEQIGFEDGGKVQVLMRERGEGSYYVHFISRPRELTRDDELVPLPRQLLEWLVVDTCRRLARSSGNIALQASLEGEARELQARCMRDIGAQQRGKRDRMYTQRRMPNLKYRGGFRPWGNA